MEASQITALILQSSCVNHVLDTPSIAEPTLASFPPGAAAQVRAGIHLPEQTIKTHRLAPGECAVFEIIDGGTMCTCIFHPITADIQRVLTG